MIKYDNNTIAGWYKDGSELIKVYKNGAVCYYKAVQGDTGQTPCFAVVNDISQYSETEFVDVYDKATDKWYKLNNLDQYEEYGVYGSGRTSCEGSTSRLPQGYTEVEYVENTSTAYIDTGAYLDTSNFEIGYDIVGNSFYWGFTHQGYGGGTWITVETNTAFFGNYNNRRVTISPSSEGNTIKYESQRGITVNGTYTPKTFSIGSDSIANTPLYIFGRYDFRSRAIDTGAVSKLKSFYLKNNGTLVRDFVPAKRNSDDKYGMYDLVTGTFYLSPNNVDFIGGEPIAPTDCVTTYKGKLTIDDGYEYEWDGSQWVSLGEVSGSTATLPDYPKYYAEKDEPENNVVFTDMEDALAYQCPWVGMDVTIDNTPYLFGDSYEWLTKYGLFEVSGEYLCYSGDKYEKMEEMVRNVDGTWSSQIPAVYEKGDLIEADSPDCSRLPDGYTEVEYIRQPSSTLTQRTAAWTIPITNMVSGDSFTIVFSMDSTNQYNTSKYISIFGSDEVFAIRQDSGYGYNLNTKYFTNANTARGNYTMEYNTKLSFNYKPSLITVTNVATGVQTFVNLSQSSAYNPSGNLGVYGYWYGGTNEYLMRGNIYEIKIEGSNDTLKYDYIPCKRDSDNKVGLYDIVNNLFTSPSGFTITAGPVV